MLLGRERHRIGKRELSHDTIQTKASANPKELWN